MRSASLLVALACMAAHAAQPAAAPSAPASSHPGAASQEPANGWPHIAEAIALLAQIESEAVNQLLDIHPDATGPDYGTLAPHRPIDPDLIIAGEPEAARFVFADPRLANVIAALDRAAASPSIKTDLLGTSASSSIRRLARFVAARMRLAAAEGDWPAVEASVHHLRALVRAASTDAPLIGWLVAAAVEAMALQHTHEVVASAPEATLARLRAIWEPSGWSPPIADAFGRERTYSYEELTESTFVRLNNDQRAKREAALRLELDAMFDLLHELALLDGPARRISPHAEALQKLESDLGGSWKPEFRVIAELPSALKYSIATSDQQQVHRLGLRTRLALELFKRRHGTYPPSLEALVPEFRDAVAPDAVSGKPLVYRLEPDGTFVLYSVGYDQTDDGGRFPKADHGHDALRSKGEGFDFPIWPQR